MQIEDNQKSQLCQLNLMKFCDKQSSLCKLRNSLFVCSARAAPTLPGIQANTYLIIAAGKFDQSVEMHI